MRRGGGPLRDRVFPPRVCLNDGDGAFTCSDVSAEINSTRGVALGFLQLPDLAITKTDEQTTAVPGGTLTYVIAAGNSGPLSVSATVSDPFPPDLSCAWTCIPGGGATCTEGPVSGDIVDAVVLPAGAVATYFAVCSVDSAAVGTLANTASVVLAEGTERDPTNNAATDVDALTPQADLAITNDDGQATAVPGSAVTYVIGVSNPGPSDVAGAQVSDQFSSALSCTWTCAGRGGATCAPGPVAGDIAEAVDLPVGGGVGYLAVCVIDPGATGVLVNAATVSPPAGVTDPVTTNNSAFDLDQLIPEADLAVTKDDGVTSVAPGDPVTYTIVAANPGPSDALAATVEDVFPPELIDCEWTCATAGGALCTGGPVTGDLVDSVDLPAGGSAIYTAACIVDPGAEFGVLENTATITGPPGVTDPEPGNNSATDTDTDSGPVIFADGFESGNTSTWSATVP